MQGEMTAQAVQGNDRVQPKELSAGSKGSEGAGTAAAAAAAVVTTQEGSMASPRMASSVSSSSTAQPESVTHKKISSTGVTENAASGLLEEASSPVVMPSLAALAEAEGVDFSSTVPAITTYVIQRTVVAAEPQEQPAAEEAPPAAPEGSYHPSSSGRGSRTSPKAPWLDSSSPASSAASPALSPLGPESLTPLQLPSPALGLSSETLTPLELPASPALGLASGGPVTQASSPPLVMSAAGPDTPAGDASVLSWAHEASSSTVSQGSAPVALAPAPTAVPSTMSACSAASSPMVRSTPNAFSSPRTQSPVTPAAASAVGSNASWQAAFGEASSPGHSRWISQRSKGMDEESPMAQSQHSPLAPSQSSQQSWQSTPGSDSSWKGEAAGKMRDASDTSWSSAQSHSHSHGSGTGNLSLRRGGSSKSSGSSRSSSKQHRSHSRSDKPPLSLGSKQTLSPDTDARGGALFEISQDARLIAEARLGHLPSPPGSWKSSSG
ncbi:unnamed protein product [Chrysoparadoxa australica]